MTESEPAWRGLHPVSVAVNLVPRAWRFVREAWPLFLIIFWGGQGAGFAASLVNLWLLSLFMMSTVGSVVIHFLTLRYRVHAGKFELRTGLLYRQVRIIPPERIQNVEQVKNVFHRMSGLVEVRIETASGGNVEGLLSALSQEDADQLSGELNALRRRTRPPREDGEEPPIIAENGVVDLVRYGLTMTRLGAVVVAMGALFEVASWVEPERTQQLFELLGGAGVAALAVGLVTGAWLMGPFTTMLSHYGYRLVKDEGVLVSEEGLFTRRRVELPIDKVQLVTVREPWVRRVFGFGSVHIESAASRVGPKGTSRSEAMVPVVDIEDVEDVIREALPQLDLAILDGEWKRPHPNALWSGSARRLIRAMVISAVMAMLFWPYGLLALTLVPLAAFTAWLDYVHQGWLVTDDMVLSRFGWWTRQTSVLSRRKVQSLVVGQGPLMRGLGLGRLGLRVAGSMVVLPDLAWDDAKALELELLPR
jgi:putative membrane protein